VSSLLNELSQRRLLTEVSRRAAPSSGRRPALIALNRSAGLGIGIDIGAGHLAVAIGDLSRAVHAEHWWTDAADAPLGIECLIRRVEQTMREADADRDAVIGAAVSIATPVSSSRPSATAPCFVGLTGGELADELAAALRIPVSVENDATLGALSELTWEPGSRERTIAYVKWASRVGAGIAIDGAVFRGSSGCAGEIGHLTIDPNGPRCWCGSRGCLELYCGGSHVLRTLLDQGRNVPDLQAVVDLAAAGDDQVLRVVRQATSVLSTGLAHLVNLVNPAKIVIGGELSRLGDLVLEQLRRELHTHSFVARSSNVCLTRAQLGHRASVFGALALVLTEQQTDIPAR